MGGRRIALWGLTFKAGRYDLRESPALEIACRLTAQGASVQAYDPTVVEGTFEGIEVCSTPWLQQRPQTFWSSPLNGRSSRSVDLTELASLMSAGVIVDAAACSMPLRSQTKDSTIWAWA